jgi:hypothetical protein
MVRRGVASGQFYPEDPELLKQLLRDLFSKANIKSQKNFGFIAPHAGYIYSGLTAAISFKNLQKADTYIIIGTNHHTPINSISTDDFETPLGTAKNDKRFSEILLKNKIFTKDEQRFEHSIEVQLPFLQYLDKNAKIVPILASTRKIEELKEIARLITDTAKKLKRKIRVIASSDFTHYGYSYEFVPFTAAEAKTKIEELDKKAIKSILILDSKGFLEKAEDTTICGQAAIAAAIETCKILGSKKAILLKYTNSAKISGSYDNVVSYASVIFV